ncbi:MAG: S41 family peptidase [Verrucomicrobiota bacterium]|nr:S41 family peptidase [Verrucomicrobiota bacterium]
MSIHQPKVLEHSLVRIIKAFACGMFMIFQLTNSVQAATSAEHFRNVWEDFRQTYSYFEVKGIDWDAVYETNKSRFEASLSAEEFAVALNESLSVLHDWHVAVQKPDGVWIGTPRPVARNYPVGLPTQYISKPYENYKSAGALIHTILTNNVAHVVLPTLDTATLNKISDADLLSFFQSMAGLRGVILDLRRNGGGNELHARRIAGFFLNRATLYGYTRTRTGPGPFDFTELTAKEAPPHPVLYLSAPMVALVGQGCLSSAESFALMLREAPNAVLMGDRTRGGSGNPVLRSISELGINYTISTWIAYTPEQEIIEDRGIQPAIRVLAEASFNDEANRDYLLEQAIGYIEARHAAGDPERAVNWRIQSDMDRVPDVEEYWAGTNPKDSESVLRLAVTRVQSGEVEVRWVGAAGRTYTLESAADLKGNWTTAGSFISNENQEFRQPLDLTPPNLFLRLSVKQTQH